MRFIIGFTFALSLVGSVFAANTKVKMEIDLVQMGVQRNALPAYLDLAGFDLKKGTAHLIGSMEYYETLKDSGIPIRIIKQQPQGLDDRYLNPDEIVQIIAQLKEEYPELVHVVKLGNTLKGRPIYAVRLSTQENVQYKPTILFNGMHHAREIMTTEVTTDIMKYLAHNYDNPDTPWVAGWLENIAIWVLPQVNPDGNDLVWNYDTWWRKNARGSGSSTWGVDLNRNYPYMWGACRGSSGSKRSQTYRGESAGSEPETQAVMKLVRSQNFTINVSYHSYSELVLAPYGCRNHYTPEDFIFQNIGAELAKTLERDSGSGHYDYGIGWEILYPVDGEDMSWMYNEQNTLAYVIEINSSSLGFQPSYEKWRDISVKRQRKGWMHLLNRLLTGPQVRGKMVDAETGKAVEGKVSIAGLKYQDETPRKGKNGFYYKVLTPGEYELVFSAPGYESQTVALSIDSDPVEFDVHFEKSLF